MDANTLKKYDKYNDKQLLGMAERWFNKSIRLRDSSNDEFECISCGNLKTTKGGNLQAGHYYPAGQYKSLKFDRTNVNGECRYCNFYSGDHLIGARERILERHGQEELDRIDFFAKVEKQNGRHRIERLKLIEVIESSKRICKELTKRFVL